MNFLWSFVLVTFIFSFIQCIKEKSVISSLFILFEKDKWFSNYILAIISVMCILHLRNINCTYMSFKFVFKRDLLLSTRCKYEKFKQYPLLNPLWQAIPWMSISETCKLSIWCHSIIFSITLEDDSMLWTDYFFRIKNEKTGPWGLELWIYYFKRCHLSYEEGEVFLNHLQHN